MHNLAAEVCFDAFAVQDVHNCAGNVFVLARNEVRRELDHGYLAAETSIDLCEFKPDVAAAKNDQMRRKKIHIHHRAVGEVADFIDPGDRRRQCATSDIDKYPPGFEDLAGNLDRMWSGKSRMVLINRAALEIFKPLLNAVTRAAGHMIFPGLDGFHIDSDLAWDFHAEIGPNPRPVGGGR